MTMIMNPQLLYAILSMDAYHRGYGAGIAGLPSTGQVGTATLGLQKSDAQAPAVSFFAQAYTWIGTPVISYRGTDLVSDETIAHDHHILSSEPDYLPNAHSIDRHNGGRQRRSTSPQCVHPSRIHISAIRIQNCHRTPSKTDRRSGATAFGASGLRPGELPRFTDFVAGCGG
jgi:hypothetical protein